MAAKLTHISVGGVPYEIAGGVEAGGVTPEMLSPTVVDGTTIVLNDQGQISLAAAGTDGKITASMLADDVWTRVAEIMDTGFGEVLNGSY